MVSNPRERLGLDGSFIIVLGTISVVPWHLESKRSLSRGTSIAEFRLDGSSRVQVGIDGNI